MSELITTSDRLDDTRLRLERFARDNSGALVLGSMLVAALAVSLAPAAAETRCMLAGQGALGMQGAFSLAIVLAALAWRTREPALRVILAQRANKGATALA